MGKVNKHEVQSVFKVEKIEGITEVELINEGQKRFIVYELLGGSPSDLLLPRNFLIVEGKSEVELLSRMIDRIYSERPKVQVIPADGDIEQAERSMVSIEKLFVSLDDSIYQNRVVVLCDKSRKAEKVNQFLSQRPNLKTNNQFFELPTHSLEEYYPNRNGWKKTREEVKSMACDRKVKLARRVGNEISREEFESEMPMFASALSRCYELAFE
ncbi:MAG: hypothetical protein H6755_07770 [Candidatus Omnitrophica bacterium]|nr:hypothetical protein [Candidatus Omnitrophota bacterium]